MLPLLLAPLLQGLFAQGLGTLANAVMAKGKDVIEEKLGVDIEKAMQTPEGLQQLKQAEIDHEEFLINSAIENRKLDLQEKSIDVGNTINARDSNSKIQESANASWAAKNAAYFLDYIIVGGTMVLAYMIFFVGIPAQNKDIAFAAFGSLLTMCGTIINFHRGSSSGSKDKTDDMLKMLKGAAK
jgi:hypothetical protein